MTTRSELVTNLLALLGAVIASILFWEQARHVVIFVGTLGVLIAVHEWGHFIAARASGVRVYEFALGMGPKLITYMRKNGTEYTIRALPIGGFVYPKGMQPDDPITSDGINGRRPAERALISLAGPLMNAILAVLILTTTGALLGEQDPTRTLVGQVERKQPAATMEVIARNGEPVSGLPRGLKIGDQILAVNGKPVERIEQVATTIHPSAGQPITITVRRKGDTYELRGTPLRSEIEGKFLVVSSVPAGSDLALQPGDQLEQINGQFPGADENGSPDQIAARMLAEKAGQPVSLVVWRGGTERLTVDGTAAPVEFAIREDKRVVGQLRFAPIPGLGPPVGIRESIETGFRRIGGFFSALANLFSRPKELRENVGGPVAIFAIAGQFVDLPLFYYALFLASLSLSLAVFNLLPIPALDGGHLLLLAIEVLRRRRLSPDQQKFALLVGVAIIGCLFIVILWKDIIKHFG